MGRIVSIVLVVLALQFTCAVDGHTGTGHVEKPGKNALLLVAFGTSVPEAQVAYEQIQRQAKESFPDMETRWAFTSKKVRNKLGRLGKAYDSPEMAMARLMEEDFTRVAVLPLHVVPGLEFHETYVNISAFGRMLGGIKNLHIASPLLASPEDCKRVAEALIKRIPTGRGSEDAVIFMGHGTKHHPAYGTYYALNSAIQALDRNVHVACVSGGPSIEEVIPRLKRNKVAKVWLMPCMAVAGEHARNDMAGDGEESWKSILTGAGFTCEVVLKGIGEYPEIVRIWLDHLQPSLSKAGAN